jgi:uncharacterized Fe-S cluster-containing protein
MIQCKHTSEREFLISKEKIWKQAKLLRIPNAGACNQKRCRLNDATGLRKENEFLRCSKKKKELRKEYFRTEAVTPTEKERRGETWKELKKGYNRNCKK